MRPVTSTPYTDMLFAKRNTENEAELLRRNCVATKMLSVYAKWKGAAYLKATLQTVLDRLVLTSKDLDLELDPARTTSAEELQKNALQLRVVTKVFIDDICNSASHIPVSFRKICNIVRLAQVDGCFISLMLHLDIISRHEAIPRSQIYCGWVIHIFTLLLPRNRRPRR